MSSDNKRPKVSSYWRFQYSFKDIDLEVFYFRFYEKMIFFMKQRRVRSDIYIEKNNMKYSFF